MDPSTESLLDRLRKEGSRADWDRFVSLYTPLLEHWAQRLAPRDGVDDLVQDVLLRVMQKLQTFAGEGDRSFLAWLRTIMLNRWRDLCRRKAKQPLTNTEVETQGMGEGDFSHVTAADDRMLLVRRALQIMQADFETSTWQACWENVAVGRPAGEVAANLGVSVDVVYAASYRVIRRLRNELVGAWD
jgi:RNA polymerase sigma-70 factor (ECF subfamily)